jgi:hypothetical protein
MKSFIKILSNTWVELSIPSTVLSMLFW